MTSTDSKVLLRAAMGAVRDCADMMESEAAGLQQRLPELAMDERLRPAVLELSAQLQDTSARVMFEIALLQAELGEGKADVATAVQRLSNLDSTLMRAIAASTDVLNQLEAAAERDEAHEPAFAVVMQAVRVMLRKFGTARAATSVIDTEEPAPPRPPEPPPPLRRAADGSLVVLEVGAEGGSLTLIGREDEAGEWRFARMTNDQIDGLFGEEDVPITGPDLTTLPWVDGWDAGLSLMDRYPWVRLHPVYVHPEFVERVRAAVEERLANLDERSAGRARGNWEWRFEEALKGRRER